MSPTETIQKDGVKREISVEIPAEEVSRETEAIVQKYQKVARLPGFRAGHVPPSIIRQRFKEDLKSDVVEALVPRYFRKEAEKQGLVPVSQPRVTDLHIHEGEPLRFKASFEIMPEIKVEGYKELRAEHPAALPTLVLAGKLVSHAPDITRLVDRLEQRGLVARRRLADNRRVVQVGITEAGLARLKQLDQPVRDCHQKQLGHLSHSQLQSLIELLRVARQPHEQEESSWR